MDDPWGSSPWASSDTTLKHNPPSPLPANSFLSPPPRALVGGSSPGFSSQSLWADDNGLADWTRADQSENTRNSSDWGAWAESGLQAPQYSSGRVSPIAWPSSTAASPGLKPILRSRASSVFRHHALDPWAAESSLTDRRNTLSTPSPSSSPNPQASAATEVRSDYFGKASSIVEGGDLSDEAAKSADVDTFSNKDVGTRVEREPDDHDASLGLPSAPGSSDADADIGPGLGIHDAQSRHSSISSIESHNVPERQDSPITSIDEEPKLGSQPRPQPTSRKASGKVHELVGLYDGLMKAVVEDPPVSERRESSREKSRERQLDEGTREIDDQADFGDFEDAEANGDDHNMVDAGSPPKSSGRSATPKTKMKGAFLPNTEVESRGVRAPIPKAPSVPVQQLIDKFGPVKYEIDLTSIDELFPDLDDCLGKEEAVEGGQVPDKPITDSFMSISERKTWYRISRYGSMRKHDSGDDENYHRVAWPTSQLHSDTIKIVRRWMEEDSFTGRSTLGGSKQMVGFNWDSSAAPVELDKIFARKQPVAHSRTASIPTQKKDPVHAIASEENRASRHSIGASISPPPIVTEAKVAPIATFDWNTNAVKSPITSDVPAANDQSTNGSKSTAPSIPAPPKALKPITIVAQADLEDDDDWGEMVSSPPVDAHHVIPKAPEVSSSAVPVRNNDSVPKLSVAIPQNNGQAPKQMSGVLASSEDQSSGTDPWPLADFSIFEKSARTPKSTKQEPWPLADFSIFESPISRSKPDWVNALKPKAVLRPKSRGDDKPQEVGTKLAHGSTSPVPVTPIKAILGPVEKPREDQDQDQDETVRSIIENLPDLSYMLR
ncbi:hypothetical protein F5X99DRAFT_215789 [Biscogniauxia marginata]|nr:hypothetical protein F5X99DRAFT_215789 [Biscogniauxia marginata]